MCVCVCVCVCVCIYIHTFFFFSSHLPVVFLNRIWDVRLVEGRWLCDCLPVPTSGKAQSLVPAGIWLLGE